MAEAAQAGGSELVAWIVAAPIVSMVLCTGGVAARLFTRVRFANQELFLEDWLVIGPAYICIMGVAVTMIVATSYGLGWHTDHGISPADVEKTMKTIYAIQIPLFIAVGAIRTSLLLFIQRLSYACSWSIYLITTGLIPINIIHVLIAIFVSIFRCNPIRSTWDFDSISYTCIPRAVTYTLITIGLVVDIAIFLLPAILVIRLDIKRKKKLQSIVMFALGGGGCIVEGLRFGQIREAETSSDITYTSGVIMIFIFFQVILGMLCCCAPAIKVFAASTFASKFKCTKYFISESTEDVRETDPTRDPPSVARNPEERDLESAPESFYEEASISEAMGWEPSTEGIEMEIQDSDAARDKQDKSGTVVKERKILNLKEVLELDSQKRAALEVPPGSEGLGSARSGSSGRTDEFQATPVEWGRQL
ncbi:hypothetical protein AOL_s00173g258 [Orbilia oligospora ATCC 24927]|uniref:Rhodopsin domain-containing protein n=2 Tax=Orbilia oligospora TaxID=2813651 RepID=G1XP90_ARTOA|nr:hypothetical protein AOL_s00173g258 [Orbilia oligospora ATCC 24927]EGX45157.1 hypothetical protein AOL_s00173g258 [Orbilia oligospora ATCC 24927]